MKNRSKFAALLGAGFLTFAVAGMAFAATDLNAGQVGITVGDKPTDCSDFPTAPGEGEVGLHFVLTSAAEASGSLSGSVDGTAFGPVASSKKTGGTIHWYVIVDGDASSVLNSATTDATGNQLNLSHICAGAPGGGGGGDTDQPPTDALAAPSGTSGPSDGAWLLVVALGVLLASIVVLTPARAKSRR